jgi:hypothetical protein
MNTRPQGNTTLIVASIVVGTILLIGSAFAVGIGSNPGNPVRDAKASERIDFSETRTKEVMTKMLTKIDSCAALRENIRVVEDLQILIDALPEELLSIKNPDGSKKLTSEQEAKVREATQYVGERILTLITAAANCSNQKADNENIAKTWKEIQDKLTTLTDGGILGIEIQSFFTGNAEDQDLDDDNYEPGGANNVPLLYQRNFRDVSYPNNSNPRGNISSSGCGIVATAMVLAFYGSPYSVPELAEFSLNRGHRDPENGTKDSFYPDIAKKKGLTYISYGRSNDGFSDATWNKMLDQVRQGRPVIVSGKGPAPFSSGGHFVVLTGINADGSINVNDSAPRRGKTPSYSLERLKSTVKSGRVIFK